ncbi:Na/Pi cotransporter family protein [Endomicrobium proavitum]|uniref:Putative Na/Pi-cotransporter II-related protein n=1 Tax=Endomicrobium proavitum TaxID=1408281 RepID=A0A0G3WID1_9BACT|nr:Na/Pi cotransporter family protein [Endomicrobium proavitum]AKL97640.1 putative Na/Pi-cotransporter II-related protein [Endomicrobium proavitum]
MTYSQIILIIINLSGGLALLLFAMFYINNALQKAAGEKFRTVLTSFASSKTRGVFSGIFLTSLNQSSTATMFLSMGLVGAGLLSFGQFMAVSLGASIGSTVTGQLVAFKLADYSLAIVAAGYALSFFTKGKKISQLGDVIFAFGILFFAMKLMSDGLFPLSGHPVFLDFIERAHSPFIGIAAGVLITVIMQSSGAVAGMVIALASSNVLDLNQAVYMMLGSQLGTCATVILASFKLPRTQKRTIIWQILQHVLAIIFVFPFLEIIKAGASDGAWFVFIKWVTKTFFLSENIARQVAVSHTLVAVFAAVIMIPLLKYFEKFIFILYPFKNQEIAFGTVYIDSKNIEKNTDKALELTKLEIRRTGEFVLDMLNSSVKAFKTNRINFAQNVSSKSFKIEILAKEIAPYIAKTGQRKLNPQQSEREIELLSVLSSFGEIAEIIDRNLMYIAKKKIGGYLKFSDDGLEDIARIHAVVYDNSAKVLTAFTSDDKPLALEAANAKASVRILATQLRQKHIARLHANLKESIETSVLHMDVLDQYERINSIMSNIGSLIAGGE